MSDKSEIVISAANLSPRFGLRELWDYRDLLMMLVRRDWVATYKQTLLGPLWYFVQPALTTMVYLFVFHGIADLSTEALPPALFYLSGIVLWNYFSESFNRIATTFVSNQNLFGKVYFPRVTVPLSILIGGSLKLGIQMSLLLCTWSYFAFTTGVARPTIHLLLFPVLLLIVAALALGSGLFIAAVTAKYRDLLFVVSFGVQLLMYVTPIIYPLSAASVKLQRLLWLNPLTHIIEGFRHGLFGVGVLTASGLCYSALVAVILLMIGSVIFRKTEQTVMDTI